MYNYNDPVPNRSKLEEEDMTNLRRLYEGMNKTCNGVCSQCKWQTTSKIDTFDNTCLAVLVSKFLYKPNNGPAIKRGKQ